MGKDALLGQESLYLITSSVCRGIINEYNVVIFVLLHKNGSHVLVMPVINYVVEAWHDNAHWQLLCVRT